MTSACFDRSPHADRFHAWHHARLVVRESWGLRVVREVGEPFHQSANRFTNGPFSGSHATSWIGDLDFPRQEVDDHVRLAAVRTKVTARMASVWSCSMANQLASGASARGC
jgi:hypothetical protein